MRTCRAQRASSSNPDISRNGDARPIEVAGTLTVNGTLALSNTTASGFELPVDTILPLREVELMGRMVPAPNRPEELLAATYGEGWRVPDPSFQYHTPRWLSRRLGGWFGGLKTHRKYWDTFYNSYPQRRLRQPSDFARWVAAKRPASRPMAALST